MSDEVNFVDLAALMKIGPDTTSEKFGTLINSSYFDGANLLGVLYQKRLVSLTTSFPGPNPVTITDTGRALLTEADTKAKEEFDHLDLVVLTQLANGKRSITDLAGAVNVRPRDLAMHLYKMIKNNYATYDFRSGTVDIMLTEKGFSQVKTGVPQKQSSPQQMMAQAQMPQQEKMIAGAQQPAGMIGTAPAMENQAMPMGGAAAPAAQPQQPMTAQEVEAKVKAAKSRRMTLIIVAVIVIIIVIFGTAYYLKLI